MIAVQEDFRARAEEVNRYFLFLRHFDEKRIKFDDHATGATMSLDEQTALFKTLKANGFLLLYNLMESTIKNAIEAIFDEFGRLGVSFDLCTHDVKKIILGNLKTHSVDKISIELKKLTFDVVVKTFRKEDLFSGNVDARKIREVATDYGFKSPHRKSDELLTVKTNRNDLAHGNKSFADVGRDFDLHRLESIRKEVTEFLEELLVNIAEYLTKRTYLVVPSTGSS